MTRTNPPHKAGLLDYKPAKFATGFLAEFRAFALKGNVVDLAVAVIIGAAFGKVVDSLVKDIFLPAIAVVLGGAADTNWLLQWSWRNINYGKFAAEVINFLIVALAVFVAIVKVIGLLQNLRRREAPAEPVAPVVPEDVRLLTEIRDLLKARATAPGDRPEL